MLKLWRIRGRRPLPLQPPASLPVVPESSPTDYETLCDDDYDYPEFNPPQNFELQPVEIDTDEIVRSLENETDWERGACIGCGTMSKVFSMSNDTTGAKCVVKIVGFNSSDRHTVEIMKECHILMSCMHPCIVKFYNYAINYREREIRLYMELMQSNLKTYISESNGGYLKEGDATIFCKQILEGLKYLHDKNIIHRDIKSSNILLSSSRSVKISDFGISKRCSNVDITKTKTACIGTYYYMAPEVILGRYCCKADVWSVGCTLVEMLCGVPPNSNMDHVQVIFYVGRTKKANYTLPIGISRRMVSFTKLLLTSKSAMRPDVNSALQHVIFGDFLTQNQYQYQNQYIDYQWLDSGFVPGPANTCQESF